jgi:hypothetical protein
MRFLSEDSLVDSLAWITAFFLFAAWPPVCVSLGNTYEAIAQARDVGVKREELQEALETLAGARGKGTRKMIEQIYDAPGVSPGDWKHIAIGTCIGILEKDEDTERQRIRKPKAAET